MLLEFIELTLVYGYDKIYSMCEEYKNADST